MRHSKYSMLFSVKFSDEDPQDSRLTETEKKLISFSMYLVPLMVLIVLISALTIPVATIFDVPILGMSNILAALFHAALVVSGRKGFVYYEESQDEDLWSIESGIFKPRYMFRKPSSSN